MMAEIWLKAVTSGINVNKEIKTAVFSQSNWPIHTSGPWCAARIWVQKALNVVGQSQVAVVFFGLHPP